MNDTLTATVGGLYAHGIGGQTTFLERLIIQ